jgi:choline dehydrogenase-like flavoprotein
MVHGGLRVLMLDVGSRDDHYASLIPNASFTHIRRTDPSQHRYFLGDEFEGVPFGRVRVGAQLTPPRAFINRDVDDLTPVVSHDFVGMESLARGGLAAGWGAGVARFTDAELAGMPITLADLEPHYRAVEARIGISGEDDDLSAPLGLHTPMMPALRIDAGSRLILDRYRCKNEWFRARGLRLGVTRLAACSQPLDTCAGRRGPHPYNDMDFWHDGARAVYRAQWTLEELQRHPNFTYLPRRLVRAFQEKHDRVLVICRSLADGCDEQFQATSLVLAAGVFGTARIVLRSLGLFDRPLQFACNPYTYAPCLNINMLRSRGRADDDARHSLSQLTAVFDAPDGSSSPSAPMHVSIYSYRSLLSFKLMKETPLNARSARRMMQALIPLLTVLGLHHADEPTDRKTLTLQRVPHGDVDRLHIDYALSDAQTRRIDQHERALLRVFRRLGCRAARRVRPGHGSSIHYAGTLPMSSTPGELQTDIDGRLAGTRGVFVADGSLLPRLPAKGLTLTLMAGANRVGSRLAARLGARAEPA